MSKGTKKHAYRYLKPRMEFDFYDFYTHIRNT